MRSHTKSVARTRLDRGFRAGAALAVTAALSACAMQSYAPDPIRREDVGSVFAERQEAVAVEGDVTLARAADWLRTRGPGVQNALAEYRAALARAGIPTPWPNPGFEVGPEYGFGPDVDVNRVVPFGSLSISIPLSGRLGRQDELNQARAQLARANALATFRELYLELRARYIRLAVSRKREIVRRSVLASARESLSAAEKLVAAGVASALDLSLSRLEHARERGRMVDAQLASTNAAADFADLVAVPASRLGALPETALPRVPAEAPGMDRLQELIIEEHPGLFRGRAEYEVAERQLHLEVAKQYPDLVLGPSLRGETGDRKTVLGLSLGVELPLFDRNQQAIAEARKRREQVRTNYVGEAHRILTAVERARAAVALSMEQHRILRDEVLPVARSNVDIAKRSVAAGAAAALQLLDAERSLRQVRIDVLEAQLGEQAAWSDLEKAVGVPLVAFQSDPADEGRAPPAELASDTEQTGAEKQP